MTLREAAKQGIARLRRDPWPVRQSDGTGCYVRMDLFEDGKHGPWLHSFDPFGSPDADVPILLFHVDMGEDGWEPWDGPLHPADK